MMTWPLLKHHNLALSHNPANDSPFFFFGQYNICRRITNYLFYNCFWRRKSTNETKSPSSHQDENIEDEQIIYQNDASIMDGTSDKTPPGPSTSAGSSTKKSSKPEKQRFREQFAQTPNLDKQDEGKGKHEADSNNGKKKTSNTKDSPSPAASTSSSLRQNGRNKTKNDALPQKEQKVTRPGARIHVNGPLENRENNSPSAGTSGLVNYLQTAVTCLPIRCPIPAVTSPGAAGGHTIMGNQGLRQHVETSTKTGVFHLSKAKLHEFPPELAKIVNALRSIDMSENKISHIPQNISGFVNLKHLNLSHNQIEVIPEQIGQLAKLETLSLSNNRIKSVPPTVANLQKLRDVNLGSNLLSTFPVVFSSLNFLSVLDLSHNRIPEVPDGVGGLQVVELILNQNQIRRVSKDLAQCSNLKTLRLQENTLELSGLPKEILSDSPVSLISVEGNLFDVKQLRELEGYDQYMERYSSTKKKLT